MEPFIWTSAATLPHRFERVLPGAAVQLLFNLDADAMRWIDGPDPSGPIQTLPGGGISGPYDRAFCIDTHDQQRLVGAVLPVGAAQAWLGLPIAELTGTHVAADALPALRGLRQRLLEAPWTAVAQTLQAELRRRLDPVAPIATITHAVSALEAGHRVRDVERDLGMSARRLRRRFVAAVGLTPKRYQRVHRFRRTLRRLARGPVDAHGLATLALDMGYTDQAHMTREFRALGATTPATYLPRAPDDIAHIALGD